MFRTEPIRYLQSFASEGLTDFMVFISQLGYATFYIPILILVTFGISFRKGFLLTQVMLWVGVVTFLLKNVIGLPRPADVDSAVRLLEENMANPTPLTGKGGVGFWELPDREAIELFRAQPEWSFGFPSGHVSGASTFWVGLAVLFRCGTLKAAALAMLLLMPLSRMYLGRHFVADVLGGWAVAAVFLVATYVAFIRPGTGARLLELSRLDPAIDTRTMLLLLGLLLLPLGLMVLVPVVRAEDLGRMFGLNAAFLLIASRGVPADAASWPRRAGRVVLAFVAYAVAAWLTGRTLGALALDEDLPWVGFVASSIPTFIAFRGGVAASLGLKLFAR